MTVKTQKQLAEEQAQQVVEQDTAAREQMAQKAGASENMTADFEDESEVSSDDDAGVWSEFLDDGEQLPDTQVTEEPEDSVEEQTAEDVEEVEEMPAEESAEESSTEEAEDVDGTQEETEQAGEEDEVEIPREEEEQPQETRTPEEVKAELEQKRTEARNSIAEQFQLTEDQVEALERNPNEVLPQLAADLYLGIFDSVYKAFQSQMPMMVQQTMQMERSKQENEKKFFGAWPQLAKKEYLPVINRIADQYRAMNPQADPEQAVKEIGAQAWVALKLPLDELIRHTGGDATVAAQQAQQGNVTQMKPSRKPSGTGRAVSNAPAPKPKGVFEQLAEEFEEDEFNY